MFGFLRNYKIERLEREVRGLHRDLLDKQAELDAAERLIEIKNTEIEALAEVVARDRERVLAETAEASTRVANAEVR